MNTQRKSADFIEQPVTEQPEISVTPSLNGVRKYWGSFASLFLLTGMLFPAASIAQDCSGYYFFQNNKTITMASFNKKGKEMARQMFTVSNVSNTGGSVTADLNTELFDKKGKSAAKSTSTVKCTNGVLMMDMKMSIPAQQNEQFS